MPILPGQPADTPQLRGEASSETEGRSYAVLAGLLNRAAAQGELGVAWTRLILAVLVFLRMAVADGAAALDSGSPRFWMASVTLWAAAGVSVFTLLRLPGREVVRPYLLLSVCADVALVHLGLLSSLLWPPPSYAGLLRTPEASILLIFLIAAGVRLSPQVAVVGAVLSAVSAALLVVLDLTLNPDAVTYGPREVALAAVLVVVAAALAIVNARRTRSLVHRGAEATLTAERARQRLGVYVSEEVADVSLEQTELCLGGNRQEVAVLFCDLRGFTRYAETCRPEELVAELNAYFDAMVEVVREHGGLVDKYIGDAIMVVFGVPVPRPDDAVRAIRTARALQDALLVHNARRATKGMPPMRQGVGVHFGPAVAGNIGTRERMQYTVLGDVVNVASRLESATKEHGVRVLVSEEAVRAAEGQPGGEELPPMHRLTTIPLRGRRSEMAVYELKGPTGSAGC